MLHSRYRIVVAGFTCVGLLVAVTGCSGTSAAFTGLRVGKNLFKGGSNLRISLDGQEAKQSKLKKAATGHSNWKVEDPVGTSPTLSFRLRKPEKTGRITFTAMSIFQKFEADYSHQAEFVVAPKDNKAESQLKPDTDYNLGDLPDHLKILDVRGNDVDAVKLIPGVKYMLQLTIKADKSETLNIYFKTK